MNQRTSVTQAAVPSNDDISLSQYLDVFLANRKLVFSIAAIVLALGLVYTVLTPPVYKADILVQVEDSTNANKSPLGDISSLFDVKMEPSAEVEVLQSRMIVDKTVDDLKLYITAGPKRFPVIGDWIARQSKREYQPGLFGFGGYAWGNESIGVSSFDVPDDLEGEKFTLVALGDGRYRLEQSGLATPIEGRVGQMLTADSSDGAIKLKIERLDAKPGTEFVLTRNSRQKVVEDLQDSLTVVEKGKDSGIISASLKGTDPKMIASILNSLGDEYVAQKASRKVAEADTSLRFLEQLLPQLKQQVETAEARYDTMRNERGTFNLSDEGKAYMEQSVATQTRLLELQQKRTELVNQFTNQYPSVRIVDQQIAEVNAKLNGITEQLKKLPDMEQGALRLTRDIRVYADLYADMLNNLEQLRLVKAGKAATVRVLDHAVQPRRPSEPNKRLLILGAAVLGLLLGTAAAFLRAVLRGGATNPQDLEQQTGLNVFATVPLSQANIGRQKWWRRSLEQEDGFRLASEFPGDPSVESLQLLRTALHFAMREANNNLVMLTGPTDRVGKSFLSANLAAVMATAGKRVLLVDADMRRGHLEQYFSKVSEPGLSDYLASDAPFDSVIQRDVLPGLDFIANGTMSRNPAELLLGDDIARLEAVSADYDVVLIDTPPVLSVSDAATFAHRCGTVFLVTRFERTSIGEVLESVKQLRQTNAVVKGIIFNGVDANAYRYSVGSKDGRNRYTSYRYALPSREKQRPT